MNYAMHEVSGNLTMGRRTRSRQRKRRTPYPNLQYNASIEHFISTDGLLGIPQEAGQTGITTYKHPCCPFQYSRYIDIDGLNKKRIPVPTCGMKERKRGVMHHNQGWRRQEAHTRWRVCKKRLSFFFFFYNRGDRYEERRWKEIPPLHQSSRCCRCFFFFLQQSSSSAPLKNLWLFSISTL